jgi:hypothetical protein
VQFGNLWLEKTGSREVPNSNSFEICNPPWCYVCRYKFCTHLPKFECVIAASRYILLGSYISFASFVQMSAHNIPTCM